MRNLNMFLIHQKRLVWLCAFVFLSLPWLPSFADDSPTSTNQWTHFRGPNGSGVAADFAGPLPWTAANVLQRVDLPGAGNGSPVLWNDNVFLQSSNEKAGTRYITAINKNSGKILWSKPSNFTAYSIHKFSSYASSTPCVDADRVYNVFASPESLEISAYSHAGDLLWQRDLGSYVSQHGFGSSPMLYGKTVILFDSQDAEELPPSVAPGADRMLALDCATGNTVWETPLASTRVCYGVPVLATINGRDTLLGASTGEGFFGLDAKTGKKVFHFEAFQKRVVASLSVNENVIVASQGSGNSGSVIALDRKSLNQIAFRIDRAGPYVPTTLIANDRLYIWSDSGIVSCASTKDGKNLWTKRVGGNFSASPIMLAGKLVNCSHEGIVTVIDVADEAKDADRVLSSFELGQTVRATLAADANQIYIRSDTQLWMIGAAK